MVFLPRGNDALHFNPPIAFALLVLCFPTPESNRVFHYLFTCVLLAGSVTYFAEASDLGWDAVEQASNGLSRQIFFAKYINWAVAFPSITLALGLLSGVSWTTILSNIFISWFWVITYLVAAYTTTAYKWGFFAFGTFAWLILAMSTLNEGHEAAARVGVARDYIILAAWTNMLWLLYPVAFGLSDGGDRIGVTSSFIFFGILDTLLMPALSFGFLFLARKWDYGELNFAFSESRSGLQSETPDRTKAQPNHV